MRYALALMLVAAVALGVGATAHARAEAELPYGLPAAFSTALRFVVVDRGCKVVDKDAEAAYVSFECTDDGKAKRGSVEIFKVPAGVRAQVTLGDDTHGMELRWLELYERKLRDELGTPLPRPTPPPAAPKKDGGA